MKKVGLALGSGGWKGLAHVGVIKTLEKAGIPIDYVAGSSAGSLIGGLYSSFGNSEKLENFFLNFGYRDLLKIFSDPHLKSGLLKGDKAAKYLNKITKDKDIEDLDIKFCSVSTDLITGKTVYIRHGNLAQSIRASCSVPILFDPQKRRGKILIDGASTEPVPVRAVREMGADFVIAVNLNTGLFPMKEEDFVYKTRILLATNRAMIDKLAEYNCREADVVITPRISKQKFISKLRLEWFLKFVKEKEVIEDGVEAAEKKITMIKKLLESEI
ncbi:patatin-like phospholipase family protein [Patescibacteria group bacterium]